jgi:hypothetical protein
MNAVISLVKHWKKNPPIFRDLCCIKHLLWQFESTEYHILVFLMMIIRFHTKTLRITWILCIQIYNKKIYDKKVQKDKHRSTKHTHKTKDRVTRTPLKIGGELRCSGNTSDTRRVNLVTNGTYTLGSIGMPCIQHWTEHIH